MVENDGYRPLLSQPWTLIRCVMSTNAILFNTVGVWCPLSPGIRPCFQLFQPKTVEILLVHFNQNRFRLKWLFPIEHTLLTADDVMIATLVVPLEHFMTSSVVKKRNPSAASSFLLLTFLKQPDGFFNCSNMAHLTDAWRMFASYSREFCWPAGVPRERSYPGSLKYGSGTRMSDWVETRTWDKQRTVSQLLHSPHSFTQYFSWGENYNWSVVRLKGLATKTLVLRLEKLFSLFEIVQ